jgi:hypothetical protein
MTVMARSTLATVSLAALALALPALAHAQPAGGGSSASDGDLADVGDAGSRRSGRNGTGRGGGKTVQIAPYIEFNQLVDAQLSPADDVVTYSQAAVGVDAVIAGRNTAVSASVRYEYHKGWGRRASDGDSVTGVVSGYTTVTPGLTLNASALASRARSDGEAGGFGGSYSRGGGGDADVYAVQAGPSYAGRVGDLSIGANYRAGFTKIDAGNDDDDQGRPLRVDTFDQSVTHVADAQAGFAPGTVLPVGIGVAGSLYQEDVGLLDQRVRDAQARAIVTVPVSRTVQVAGALGYENVEISARDAVRDAAGNPVIGDDGRYVTNKNSPRFIAYETDGLIWDVGVMWRPSRRTSLSAHVGRRYGTMNYNGTFSWAPDSRRTLSVAAYNTISAFGGNLGRVLDNLPEEFVAVRNPITGDIGGCLSSLEGNNCLTGAFGTLRSSTFRSRGVAASYSMRFGAIDAGLGIGYDNRKYLAAPGTVLAINDGQVEQNYWLTGNLGWTVDERSGWNANAYANLIQSDLLLDDITNVGLSAAYYRALTARLRATAALGIDGTIGNEFTEDFWTASALVGMRYNF